MKAFSITPAFLLQSSDLGESDRLLTFYTQEGGKIKGVARGARKSRKRFGAALDWFHLLKLQFRQGRSELCHYEGVEMIERSQSIMKDLRCYGFGAYFLELVRELTLPHHPEPSVFDLLHLAIRQLEDLSSRALPDRQREQSLESLSRFFELNLLDHLGFRPNLEHCGDCQDRFSQEIHESFSFCLYRGAIVCPACAQKQKGRLRELAWESLSLMRLALINHDDAPSAFEHVFTLFGTVANRQVRFILADLIHQHTQKKLRSLRFLDEIPAVS